jgi:Tfp pilus assembly protein PilO
MTKPDSKLRTHAVASQKTRFGLAQYSQTPGFQGLIIVVLSVLLIVVFLMFAIKPSLVKIAELRKQVEESQKVLTQLDSKVRALESAAKNWDKIKANLGAVENAVPMATRYRLFNRELVALAAVHQIGIANIAMSDALIFAENIDPYNPDKKMEIAGINLVFRATGDYQNLMGFVNELTNIERVVAIETINIVPDSKIEGGGLALNITGSVYYLADTVKLSPILESMQKKK